MRPRIILFFAAVIGLCLPFESPAQEPAQKPFTKDLIRQALKYLNADDSPDGLIPSIVKRGVDFQLTPAEESEWKTALRATPKFLTALRASYRASAAPAPLPPPPAPPTGPTPEDLARLSGPPLTKNEIVLLLQSGLPQQRIEEMVQVRGVARGLSDQDVDEIAKAGAPAGLVKVIRDRMPPPPPPPTEPPAPIEETVKNPETRARLIFYMPCGTSLNAAKSQPEIYADKLKLAQMTCGRFFYVMALPNLFSICVAHDTCLPSKVSAGATYYFRVAKSRKYNLSLVTEEVGAAELQAQSAEALDAALLGAPDVSSTDFNNPPRSAIVHGEGESSRRRIPLIRR